MEIDLGINGFRDFGEERKKEVWGPKPGLLNLWLNQNGPSGYESSYSGVKYIEYLNIYIPGLKISQIIEK